MIAAAKAVMDHDTMRRTLDRGHRAAEPDTIGKGRGEFLDIAPAAAFDRPPGRAVILQQAMVGEEGDEILGREVQHLGCRRRPDRRPHRREIIGQKPRRELFWRK
jgi:hypothetical protein